MGSAASRESQESDCEQGQNGRLYIYIIYLVYGLEKRVPPRYSEKLMYKRIYNQII